MVGVVLFHLRERLPQAVEVGIGEVDRICQGMMLLHGAVEGEEVKTVRDRKDVRHLLNTIVFLPDEVGEGAVDAVEEGSVDSMLTPKGRRSRYD